MHNLTICLRVYPGIAEKQKVFCNDKVTLYTKSLSSLIQSCGKLTVFYYILLDNCPKEYETITNNLLQGRDYSITHYHETQGNAQTFAQQVDILSYQTYSDVVYFAEDDYLYIPGSIQKFYYHFIKDKAEFATLYYSPDYQHSSIHHYSTQEHEYDHQKYGYFGSTTMTFFVKKEALLYYQNWLLSYSAGNHDFSMWFSITKLGIFNPIKPIIYLCRDLWSLKLRGYIWYKCHINVVCIKKAQLMAPLKSGATHIDKDGISSGIDWQCIWDNITT